MAHPAQIGSRIRRHTRVRYADITSALVSYQAEPEQSSLTFGTTKPIVDSFTLSLPGDDQTTLNRVSSLIMNFVDQLHNRPI